MRSVERSKIKSLRSEIDEAVGSKEPTRARFLLHQLWDLAPTVANANFVRVRAMRMEDVKSRKDRLPITRVAFVRSFTIEPIVPLLTAAAWLQGLSIESKVGDFGNWALELLSPDSSVYRFSPHIVFLAVQTRDLVPELWEGFTDLSSDEILQSIQKAVDVLTSVVSRFRNLSGASLVIHLLELPEQASHGILDPQMGLGQREAILQINDHIRRLCQEIAGIYALDYQALKAMHGHERWFDHRKWLSARMPISSDCMVHMAHEWLSFVCPLVGRSCKALVLDLDNTLWGGVVGEDGIQGIALSGEYPGAAFQNVQRVALDLFHRGILLAICSKNNEEDALEAIRTHPGMLLKPNHFAAWRINWADKASNLRSLAEELNIGLDSMAFADDNPAERMWVSTTLPQVHTINLTGDPFSFARKIRSQPVFERLDLLKEDRQRGVYYAQQKARHKLSSTMESEEDFYRSLQMKAEVFEVSELSYPRVAQLTRKTNQFNLTTRRYTEQDIKSLAASASDCVLSMRSRDRFGDHGIVGVAIVRFSARGSSKQSQSAQVVCELDSFLLSCRVIGRTLETAFLAQVIRVAVARGATRIVGMFIPTAKNGPASDFFASHGFVLVNQGEKASHWELDLALTETLPKSPPWVRVDFRHLE